MWFRWALFGKLNKEFDVSNRRITRSDLTGFWNKIELGSAEKRLREWERSSGYEDAISSSSQRTIRLPRFDQAKSMELELQGFRAAAAGGGDYVRAWRTHDD
jgi:hypothetical protein